jgi:hypothetical protein
MRKDRQRTAIKQLKFRERTNVKDRQRIWQGQDRTKRCEGKDSDRTGQPGKNRERTGTGQERNSDRSGKDNEKGKNKIKQVNTASTVTPTLLQGPMMNSIAWTGFC